MQRLSGCSSSSSGCGLWPKSKPESIAISGIERVGRQMPRYEAHAIWQLQCDAGKPPPPPQSPPLCCLDPIQYRGLCWSTGEGLHAKAGAVSPRSSRCHDAAPYAPLRMLEATRVPDLFCALSCSFFPSFIRSQCLGFRLAPSSAVPCTGGTSTCLSPAQTRTSGRHVLVVNMVKSCYTRKCISYSHFCGHPRLRRSCSARGG